MKKDIMKSKESKESKRLEIVYISSADLVKLPGNPRRDKDPKAIERLSRLIKDHGFQNPLQVFRENGKYTILCGNHRFDAGLSLGMKEFPCLVYTGDKKAALARAISDNKSNEWTEWDLPILKELFIELDTGDFDIHLTGFNSHELELMMTAEFQGEPADAEPQIDRAEELNKIWQVKPGDLWQIGDHRLLCADSTKAEDVARVMGGDVDFCFTSPPYADMRDYSGGDMSVEKISSFIPASAELCSLYAVNLGLKRQDGEIQPYWNQYISAAKGVGLKLTAWNIWSRAGMGGSIANMSAMFPIEHPNMIR